MQQHMVKQMAIINNEMAHDPVAIIIIGNFPEISNEKREKHREY